MRPTRDILYVKGRCYSGDTLHVFVVHAPSRYGGARETEAYRLQVSRLLQQAIQHIGLQSHIIITGDFNDYADSPALLELCQQGLHNITSLSKGLHGTPGNYRFRGEWHSLDHVFTSPSLAQKVEATYINDAPFLLEDEPDYGGQRPFRTFQGMRYQQGFSDHLPLVARFLLH